MNSKLAIIDWGIGGISIYRLIKQSLGVVSVIYFSDTGATPYGKMSRAELVGRLNSVIGFLKLRGATHVVIGCNAASTVIPLLSDHGLRIEGMIEAAVAEAIRQEPKRLGLIGGRRTVVSGVYRRAFAESGIAVTQRIAQPLSGLIESGDTGSERLRNEALRILSPIRNASHILLACTHYPAILPILKPIVSPNTTFIDPAGAIVGKVARWKLTVGGEDEFLTSGDARQMKMAAKSAFGVTIKKASTVEF
jgi:glutamate racemase